MKCLKVDIVEAKEISRLAYRVVFGDGIITNIPWSQLYSDSSGFWVSSWFIEKVKPLPNSGESKYFTPKGRRKARAVTVKRHIPKKIDVSNNPLEFRRV